MISVILFSLLSFSGDRVPAFNEPQIIRSIEVTTGGPAYFFRPSPDGRYIGYSLGSSNLLLDTMSNVLLSIPGSYDPVFLLNNRNLVIPQPVRIYNVEDLITNQLNATPILTDRELPGVYESVAVLSQTETEVNYRIIIENGAHRSFRDFKETLNANGKTESFEALGPVKIVCTNYRFALPIISKTGREFGGLDHSVGKSRIYKLNDDGSCEVALELGQVAGKMAFSYDDRYVSFHVFDKSDLANGSYAYGYIREPTNRTTANIYLLDRKTKKVFKLSNYVDANAMYPEFLANGNIMYVVYPHDRTNFKPKFIEVRPTVY
jgi:hypothetical protein